MKRSIDFRFPAPAAALALLLAAAAPAAAQSTLEEVGATVDTLQGAADNPDCVTAAVTSQAVAEGARRVGAATGKLLGKIGVRGPATAPAAPAANPCQAQARTTAATPAVTQPVATPTVPRVTTTRPTQRQGGRNCGALGTGCADGMRPLVACMEEKDGYLWKVLADAVEAKRDRSPELSSQQLVDINADIAALRAAHAAGAARVEPVDPARPSRYNDWLTPQEYSAAAGYASQSMNEHREACHAKHSRF